METGVYCWRNRVNGKRYVGSTGRSLWRRRADHLYLLRRDNSPCKYLQHAWNKYGEKMFIFQVLERCSPEDCLTREQYWIDHYQSSDQNFGYNTASVAGSVLGIRYTRDKESYDWMKDPEWIEKIRASSTGRKHSEETKAKISAGNKGKLKGRKLTEDHRLKIVSACTGLKQSEETRVKRSKTLLGRPKSEETKLAMSKAAQERIAREGMNRKAVEAAVKANTGKQRPEEVRERIAKGNRGQKRTPEQRARILAAQRARRIRERQSQVS